MRQIGLAALGATICLLSACSTIRPPSAETPPPAARTGAETPEPPRAETPAKPARPPVAAAKPPARPPARPEVKPDLDAVPEPTPRDEPVPSWGNQPYTLFGRRYTPMTEVQPFRERGLASWYGKPFHGRRTAIGERFDMYRMMAAHPTLPLPSFARVTNLRNGKSVVVRVNDRGPYKYGRAIDLSLAAAHRLGFTQSGTTEVEIEAITSRTAAAPPIPASTQANTLTASAR